MFNDDALYRAYNKRVKGMQVNQEAYEQEQAGEGEGGATEERVQHMVDDLEKQ